MGSKATHIHKEGMIGMRRKITQMLLFGLISGSLVVLPAIAQSAKHSASAIKTTASSHVKPKKAVPSDVVKSVQEALNKEGYKLKVDGLMGKHTQIALRRYQKKHRLKVTGKADEATLGKLGIK
jgi:peptidoglycan hydrolase-like protein with peptidoglycan-binding domain